MLPEYQHNYEEFPIWWLFFVVLLSPKSSMNSLISNTLTTAVSTLHRNSFCSFSFLPTVSTYHSRQGTGICKYHKELVPAISFVNYFLVSKYKSPVNSPQSNIDCHRHEYFNSASLQYVSRFVLWHLLWYVCTLICRHRPTSIYLT